MRMRRWWLTVGCERPERRRQVADARLALRRGLDQAEQPQPGRVGEGLEDPGETLGVGTFNRLAGKRRDLRHSHFSQRSSHVFHPSTSSIDPPAYQQVRIGNLLSHKAEVSQRDRPTGTAVRRLARRRRRLDRR